MNLPIIDIHTHAPVPAPGRIVNLDPSGPLPAILEGQPYSAGIHPWNTAKADSDSIARLDILAARPQVIAIGETGLDRLRGGDFAVQEALFEHHALLADSLGKPLVIHAVRAFPALIGMKRRLNPAVPWIIHGFRGKPQLARELLGQGFYLSLGEHFNPAARAVIPDWRLLAETDDSPLPPAEILSRLGITAPLPLFRQTKP